MAKDKSFEDFLASLDAALDALQHGGGVSWGPGLSDPQILAAQPVRAIPAWVWVGGALVVLWVLLK